MSATLFIVAAPSGAGKTSLVRALLTATEGIEVSVSHTTRPARPGEEHGRDYYFVDDAAFDGLLAERAFLENARVFGNRYGTSRQAVAERLSAGRDVVLEIDWQGARLVREAFPGAVSIYILPPSREILRGRLSTRGQDSEAVIDARMEQAAEQMSHWSEFDYVVVNGEFDMALAELRAIVQACRLRVKRRGEAFAAWARTLLE